MAALGPASPMRAAVRDVLVLGGLQADAVVDGDVAHCCGARHRLWRGGRLPVTAGGVFRGWLRAWERWGVGPRSAWHVPHHWVAGGVVA